MDNTAAVRPRPRAVLVPGNGCSDVYNANWYAEVKSDLECTGQFVEVVLQDMPDPNTASMSVWLPFMRDVLRCDEHTVVIGHSSGAEACMRYLERHKLLGCVLVSACHTDLGMESERAAGYYTEPWQWDTIRANAGFIIQLHSSDDPFIPREEADFVAAQLHSEYTCFNDRAHFFAHDDVAFLAGKIVERLQLQQLASREGFM